MAGESIEWSWTDTLPELDPLVLSKFNRALPSSDLHWVPENKLVVLGAIFAAAKSDRGIWAMVSNPAAAIAYHAIIVHYDMCTERSVGSPLGRSSTCGGLEDMKKHSVVQTCGVWGSLVERRILLSHPRR